MNDTGPVIDGPSLLEWRIVNLILGVAIVAVIVIAIALFFEREQRQAFDARRAYDICVSEAEGREVLRDFVVYVLEQPGGTDLSFVETDDPDIQSVLDQITFRAPEPPTDDEIASLVDQIPVPDCEQLLD